MTESACPRCQGRKHKYTGCSSLGGSQYKLRMVCMLCEHQWLEIKDVSSLSRKVRVRRAGISPTRNES